MKLRHVLVVIGVAVLCLAAAATVPGRPLITLRVASIDAALRDIEAITKGSQTPVTRDGLLKSLPALFGTDDISFLDLTQPAAIVLPQDGSSMDWSAMVVGLPVRDGARALDTMARAYPERNQDGEVTVLRSAPVTAPDGTEVRSTLCAVVRGRILVFGKKAELVRRFDPAPALSGEGMPPGSVAVSMEVEPVAAQWKAGLEKMRHMMMSMAPGASAPNAPEDDESAEPQVAPPPPPPPPATPNSPGKNQPLIVGGDVSPPELVTKVIPAYPIEARRALVEGNVILEAIITAEGDVEAVRVLRSVPQLDQAAVDAVKQWKYKPALQNGQPVRVYFTVVVTFSLGGPKTRSKPQRSEAAPGPAPGEPPPFDPRKLAGFVELYVGLMSDAIDSLSKLQASFEVSDGYLIVHGRGVAKIGSPMRAFIDAQRDVGLPAIGRMMPPGAPVLIAGQLNWTAPARTWMKQLTQKSQTAMADFVHMSPEADRASGEQMLQRMNLMYAQSGKMMDCMRGDIAVAMEAHPEGMRVLTVQGVSDSEACRGLLASTIGKKAGTDDKALITKEILEPEKITTYVMKQLQPQLLSNTDAPPQEMSFRYAEIGNTMISGTEPWVSKAIREAAAVSEGHTPGGGGLVLADLGPFTQQPGVFGRIQVGTFMRVAETSRKARRDAKARARAEEGAGGKEPASGSVNSARPAYEPAAAADQDELPVTQDAIEAEARKEDLIRALEGPAGGIPFAMRFDEGAATVEVALPLAMFEAISKSLPKPAPPPQGAAADDEGLGEGDEGSDEP